MPGTQTGSAWRSTLITMVLVIAFLAFAVTKLPSGYGNDLSRIGQGANVAVLFHNEGAVQSLELMALIDQVRGDYAEEIEFLVVDSESEKGRDFEREQNINHFALVFFSPAGERLDVRHGFSDEAGLRTALNEIFQLRAGSR